jgi:hypothetical protein
MAHCCDDSIAISIKIIELLCFWIFLKRRKNLVLVKVFAYPLSTTVFIWMAEILEIYCMDIKVFLQKIVIFE